MGLEIEKRSIVKAVASLRTQIYFLAAEISDSRKTSAFAVMAGMDVMYLYT